MPPGHQHRPAAPGRHLRSHRPHSLVSARHGPVTVSAIRIRTAQKPGTSHQDDQPRFPDTKRPSMQSGRVCTSKRNTRPAPCSGRGPGSASRTRQAAGTPRGQSHCGQPPASLIPGRPKVVADHRGRAHRTFRH
jgi:hypothetical protein